MQDFINALVGGRAGPQHHAASALEVDTGQQAHGIAEFRVGRVVEVPPAAWRANGQRVERQSEFDKGIDARCIVLHVHVQHMDAPPGRNTYAGVRPTNPPVNRDCGVLGGLVLPPLEKAIIRLTNPL